MGKEASQYTFSSNGGNKFVCEKDPSPIIVYPQIQENPVKSLPLPGQLVFADNLRHASSNVQPAKPEMWIPRLKDGTTALCVIGEDGKMKIDGRLEKEIWDGIMNVWPQDKKFVSRTAEKLSHYSKNL
jgi:hypothetical protein